MSHLKQSLGWILPGAAIFGTIFLNVANAALLLLIWMFYVLRVRIARQTGNDMSMAVMLLLAIWLTLSQFWSGVGSIGWFTTWSLLSLPLAYVCWRFQESDYSSAWQYLRNLLAGLGTLLAVWGIAQVVFLKYGRANGPLSDPNAFGCLLNVLWFPLFSHFLTLKGKLAESKIYGSVLVVMLMAMVMTGSRTAFLIWVFLLLTMAIIYWKAIPRARLLLVTVAVACCYYIYLSYSTHLTITSYQAVASLPDVAHASASPRFLMWESTLRMWLESPWLGSGAGSWHYLYPVFRAPEENGTAGNYAHNDYLQLLQEGGVVLLLIFIVAVGTSLLAGIKKADGQKMHLEETGLILGIAAVLLHAIVNFSFYLIYINILVGIYLGQLSGQNHLPMRNSGQSASMTFSKWPTIVFIGMLVINGYNAMLSSASLALWKGDWELLEKFAPSLKPYSLASMLVSIRTSDTHAQKYVTASLEAAVTGHAPIEAKQANAIYAEVLNGYETMRTQNKFDSSVPESEARFLIRFSQLYGLDQDRINKARDLLQESLAVSPGNVESELLLAESYLLEEKDQLAISVLNDAIVHARWNRDQLMLKAEILKILKPAYKQQLSDLQEQLRGMNINCVKWECGKLYSNMIKEANQTLVSVESKM